MKLTITHQETYSRGQLLLRTFFGWFYIAIPHFFVLMFVGLATAIFNFLSWWAILFTGRYPRYFFEFRVGYLKWSMRVVSRMMNLSDGYPPFGFSVEDPYVNLEIPYPEKLSRGKVLLKTFFGFFYVMIPHGIVLYFLWIACMLFVIGAWFIVLFTGKYPAGMHNFVVGVMKWGIRVSIYFFMTDKYPPFSLHDEEEVKEAPVNEI